MSDPSPPRVNGPGDLIVAVPYLLGFHPTDSLVAVGVGMGGGRLSFAARVDLPAPGDGPELVRSLAAIVARQAVQAVLLIGYGPVAVEPVLDAARAAMLAAGLPVYDLLRVDGGRYWSCLCGDARCCPPEGVPFDATASPIAAAFTYAGEVALPDRASMAALVAPVGGADRESMQRATVRAFARLEELIRSAVAGLADPERATAVRAALVSASDAAVAGAVARQAEGGRLTDDEVGWLSVLLEAAPLPVPAGEVTELPLWTDVVRRVEEELAAPAATVLAYAAWQSGHGGLASVALDRALAADPCYEAALLLEEALGRGLPPSTVDEPVGHRRPARRGRRGGRRRVRS